MASTSDIRNGLCIKYNNDIYKIIEFLHVKPGKGPAFVRTKMKQVLTGKVVEKTFNAGVKVDVAVVEKRDMQYLYNDGSGFVFMDLTSYDQITLDENVVGDSKNFLLENQNAVVALHEGNPLYVELPASVVLEITYTEPGLIGVS